VHDRERRARGELYAMRNGQSRGVYEFRTYIKSKKKVRKKETTRKRSMVKTYSKKNHGIHTPPTKKRRSKKGS